MRVLLVDDNRALAENLGELLRAEGMAPVLLHGVAEALQAAERAPFEAAVVDVHLPDGDGVGLLEALRARQPTARYVLMTAFGHTAPPDADPEALPGMPAAVVRAHRCEAPLLVKPFEPGELLEALKGGRR